MIIMDVLLGCEYSAEEREQFAKLGHNAWSCDILESEKAGQHYQEDIFDAVSRRWDLIILHPPCTAMALCGNRTYAKGKPRFQERALAWAWTKKLYHHAVNNAAFVCLEQPKTTLGSVIGKMSQAIHPWQFGHPEQKETWLWLHNLPKLKETKNVYNEMMLLPRAKRERIFFMSPGQDRGKERARAFPGIAAAMAEQWGDVCIPSHHH
jgi:hypothetical protein